MASNSVAAQAGLAPGQDASFYSPHRNDIVIYPTAMTRFATLIIAVSFCSNAAAAPLVTFESPCEQMRTVAPKNSFSGLMRRNE